MRLIAIILSIGLVVIGCGRAPKPAQIHVPAGVNGPITSACLGAGRENASSELCQCVQYVANQTLSSGDQTRAVAFFANPQVAQNARESGGAFWERYKAFAETASEICTVD